MPGANSASAWRQAPQGGHDLASACTATASNRRMPSATAAKRAPRSAHIVTPYEAFSTLTPMIGSASPAGCSAALTGKREYGAYALPIAASARAYSSSSAGVVEVVCVAGDACL